MTPRRRFLFWGVIGIPLTTAVALTSCAIIYLHGLDGRTIAPWLLIWALAILVGERSQKAKRDYRDALRRSKE